MHILCVCERANGLYVRVYVVFICFVLCFVLIVNNNVLFDVKYLTNAFLINESVFYLY